MGYYKDLREFMRVLEDKGKLVRIKREVVKETELMSLFRWQFRGLRDEERMAFLFENVADVKGKKYEGWVVTGAYDASREMFALGLGCERYEEIFEKWHHAFDKPIEPVIVDSAPVQEVVHTGDELKQKGLEGLPIPVEDPGFSNTVRITATWITKDAETGVRNVGLYSGHLRDRDRLAAGISRVSHFILHHWADAKKRGRPLQAAIVTGVTPNIMAVGPARIPYGTDELSIAGGIAGEPVRLVKCKTVDLEVPADAEMVIEGEVSVELMEPSAAFGEYPGYMAFQEMWWPVMKVTAITHRRDHPIYTPCLVGLSPNGVIGHAAGEVMLYEFLKYKSNLPQVKDIACDEMGGMNYVVIKISKTHPSLPWRILYTSSGYESLGKIYIVVDEDVDIRDPNMINWALSYSLQPHKDVKVVMGKVAGLDPSSAPLDAPEEIREFPPPEGCSALLIDATRKWAYPPVGLAKKEYMDRAKKIWEEEGLPKLKVREPWHGYSLGMWGIREEEYADLIVKGEFLKLGEKLKERQKKSEGELP